MRIDEPGAPEPAALGPGRAPGPAPPRRPGAALSLRPRTASAPRSAIRTRSETPTRTTPADSSPRWSTRRSARSRSSAIRPGASSAPPATACVRAGSTRRVSSPATVRRRWGAPQRAPERDALGRVVAAISTAGAIAYGLRRRRSAHGRAGSRRSDLRRQRPPLHRTTVRARYEYDAAGQLRLRVRSSARPGRPTTAPAAGSARRRRGTACGPSSGTRSGACRRAASGPSPSTRSASSPTSTARRCCGTPRGSAAGWFDGAPVVGHGAPWASAGDWLAPDWQGTVGARPRRVGRRRAGTPGPAGLSRRAGVRRADLAAQPGLRPGARAFLSPRPAARRARHRRGPATRTTTPATTRSAAPIRSACARSPTRSCAPTATRWATPLREGDRLGRRELGVPGRRRDDRRRRGADVHRRGRPGRAGADGRVGRR